MFDDHLCLLLADERPQLGDRRLRHALQAPEIPQQPLFQFLADAGNRSQLGGEVPRRAPLPVEADGEAVGLVADRPDQPHDGRSLFEKDGLVFPTLDQQMADLFVAPARFDNAGDRQVRQPQLVQRGGGERQLPLAAVNEDQIRQPLLFLQQARIAPIDGFAHRGEIVRALDRLDDELAVVRLLHLAVFANDHPRDVLRALNVRDVKRLDPVRVRRQTQNILQFGQDLRPIGLDDPEALVETELGVLFDQVDHLALLAALRVEDLHATTALFAQHFFQSFAALPINRHVNLQRHVIADGVILFEHGSQEFGRIETFDRDVFPVKFSPPDDAPFAHCEQMQRQLMRLAVIAEYVNVEIQHPHHLLMLAERANGFEQIPVLRRLLESQLLGSLQHSRLQLIGQFLVFAFEQQLHIMNRFAILIGLAQVLLTGPEAAFNLVLHAGPPGALVDFINLIRTRAQLEFAVDQRDGLVRQRRGQVRAVIGRVVLFYSAGFEDAREVLVNRQLQMRVGLVILEHHVVARLVALDQVRFEDQRLGLGVGDDELEVNNARDQLLRLGVHHARVLKILAHPVAQVLRLADIEDLALRVLVKVAAGSGWKIL